MVDEPPLEHIQAVSCIISGPLALREPRLIPTEFTKYVVIVGTMVVKRRHARAARHHFVFHVEMGVGVASEIREHEGAQLALHSQIDNDPIHIAQRGEQLMLPVNRTDVRHELLRPDHAHIFVCAGGIQGTRRRAEAVSSDDQGKERAGVA